MPCLWYSSQWGLGSQVESRGCVPSRRYKSSSFNASHLRHPIILYFCSLSLNENTTKNCTYQLPRRLTGKKQPYSHAKRSVKQMCHHWGLCEFQWDLKLHPPISIQLLLAVFARGIPTKLSVMYRMMHCPGSSPK